MDDQVTPEELLSEQLLGAYYAFPAESSSNTTTGNESHWLALNNVVDELVRLGHSSYSQFKINPSHETYNGRTHARVNIANLRMNMMSVLRRMSREFGTSDPAYELSRYGTSSSSISMNQQASPQVSANSNQSQQQDQIQSTSVSIENELENLQRIVDENLSEEQLEQIREPLETFKQNPSLWRNAQKLIQVGAGFSRDVAVQFIGSVMAILAMGAR